MKATLTSIQPLYVFYIIAEAMGWNKFHHKQIEVRKNFPKAKDWNKINYIYCSKNQKSFNQIPKEYQPFMAKLLGKVVGEFVCDKIDEYEYDTWYGVDIDEDGLLNTMLDWGEINTYAKGEKLYGWHISDLKVYETPKDLSEFQKPLCQVDLMGYNLEICIDCKEALFDSDTYEFCGCDRRIKRPPQSWCYVII